jgi:hypothetical protein
MANGIASLRRYQTGGGVGDPGDDWLKKLIRELQKRANIKGLPDDPSMMRFFPNLDADDLIHLSNFDIEYDGDKKQRMGLGPKPHVVPPLSDIPTISEELRGMGIDPDDLIKGPSSTPDDLANLGDVLDGLEKNLDNLSGVTDKYLRDVMGLSEWEIAQWHADNTPYLSGEWPSETLDQPVHDLAEAFQDEEYRLQSRVTGEESIDDLIRGAGGRPPPHTELKHMTPTSKFLGMETNLLEKWKDAEKEATMLAFIKKSESDEALRVAERKKNSGIRGLFGRFGSKSIPWGSIAAPLLAAAASPAALAAETAFDFAISPESLGGTASEVPGAGRTWRESPHIDPSDEEVASFMQTLLGDSPYSQGQLARPSTTSQRALEQLIRRAQAGTPVNRYRR